MDKKYININNDKTIQLIKEISENCIECGACVKNCKLLEEHCDSPKIYFTEILESKSMLPEIPYSCTLCNLCKEVCPKSLNIRAVFKEIREVVAVDNNGQSPMKGHRAVHFHQRLSYSKLFKYSPKKNCKVIFLPGCSLSAYNPQLVEKVFDYLKSKIPHIEIMLNCCGKPTEAIGEKEKFYKYYSSFEQDIVESGAEVVITACQSCYTTILKNSKNIKVKSLWTVLSNIGIPENSKNIGKENKQVFTVHDSCPTREVNEIHEAVRTIINQLGLTLVEMKHSKKNTKCCGRGGMVGTVNPKLSNRMTKAMMSNTEENVITYCASCKEGIAGVYKKSFHILDLIFTKDLDKLMANPLSPKSTLKNWGNRYKLRYKLKK